MQKATRMATNRSDVAPALLSLAIMAAFCVAPMVHPQRLTALGAILAVLSIACLSLGAMPGLRLGVCCTAVVAWMRWGALANTWPLPLLLALAVYALVAWGLPGLQMVGGWFRLGKLTTGTILLTLAMALLAEVAIYAWFDLENIHLRPVARGWFFGAMAVAFAVTNAATEELTFRGIIFSSLDELWGPGWASLIVQALAFGMYHFYGFPHSLPGVSAAVAYGMMMGLLRRRSQGLLVPWLAHVLIDLLIVAMATPIK